MEWQTESASLRFDGTYFTLTRKNTRTFGHTGAPCPSDAASYKRRGSLIVPGPLKPHVPHVRTRLASFNRTKLHVITCKRALKRLRFKGIRHPVRVTLIRVCIHIYTYMYVHLFTRESVIMRACARAIAASASERSAKAVSRFN